MATGDNDLAERAGGGDRDAFRVLLERHYDRIHRLAYRFCGNRSDAEDIAQDICVALPRKLRAFRGDARFTTWLYRVVINAVRDFQRRRASADKAHAHFAELDELNRARLADACSEMKWVWQALESMRSDFRETALLVVAEGLSHAEAAAILQVKETTISWRMHEIRKDLKRQLDAER